MWPHIYKVTTIYRVTSMCIILEKKWSVLIEHSVLSVYAGVCDCVWRVTLSLDVLMFSLNLSNTIHIHANRKPDSASQFSSPPCRLIFSYFLYQILVFQCVTVYCGFCSYKLLCSQICISVHYCMWSGCQYALWAERCAARWGNQINVRRKWKRQRKRDVKEKFEREFRGHWDKYHVKHTHTLGKTCIVSQ